ncbi:MAG: 2-phospho-L-lactate guanylyltransferase [Ktedonobacterales bacterium]
MKLAAVVPVKSLAHAKTRLSARLSVQERATLTLWLLHRVVAAIQAAGVVADLALVSPDDTALEAARAAGIVALPQVTGDLNAGLEQGRRWVHSLGAEAVLVLLGDLPLIAADEVRGMAAMARALAETGARTAARAGLAVLAPDRAGTGTNGLLLWPPDGLPFAFGAGSFARHLELARERGIASAVYRAPGIAFDVDRPEDLDELRARGCWLPARCGTVSA